MERSSNPTLTQVTRFRSRLRRVESGCLEWTGARLPKGYGKLQAAGRWWTAHRFAYTIAHGPIPTDLCVLHRCDNPPCCEPAHLFLGTLVENNADMKRKNRQARGERLPQTRHPDALIAEIRRARARTGASLTTLSRRYGVSFGHIGAILRNEARSEAPTDTTA